MVYKDRIKLIFFYAEKNRSNNNPDRSCAYSSEQNSDLTKIRTFVLVGKRGLVVLSKNLNLTLENKVQLICYVIGLKHEISQDADLGLAFHS